MSSRAVGLAALVALTAGAGVAVLVLRNGAEADLPVVEGGTGPEGDADEDDEGAMVQAKAKICEKLACTRAQKGELGTLLREYREATYEQRIEARNLRASMAELFAAAEPDAAKLTEIGEKLGALERTIEGRAEQALLGFHRVLDDEQRRKLGKWLRRRSARDILQDRPDRRARKDEAG